MSEQCVAVARSVAQAETTRALPAALFGASRATSRLRGLLPDRVLSRAAGKSSVASVYRSFVRLCEPAVPFALNARLTTKAVRDTTTSIAAVETAAAITAST